MEHMPPTEGSIGITWNKYKRRLSWALDSNIACVCYPDLHQHIFLEPQSNGPKRARWQKHADPSSLRFEGNDVNCLKHLKRLPTDILPHKHPNLESPLRELGSDR